MALCAVVLEKTVWSLGSNSATRYSTALNKWPFKPQYLWKNGATYLLELCGTKDNHDGVITHLEPDILECKVKWPYKASLRTKLVKVMEFHLSYFKSWKMMLWKCCTQYSSKFGKLSSGHRTGKGQFSFQSQRKAMPKNAQTTAQLHSSHMLGK